MSGNLCYTLSNSNNGINKRRMIDIGQIDQQFSQFQEKHEEQMPAWATDMLKMMRSMLDLCKDMLNTAKQQQQHEQHQQQQSSIQTTNSIPFSGINGNNPHGMTMWGHPPAATDPGTLTRMINNAILDAETVKEKSKRAVIEKLPESMDAAAIVQQIAAECGVADELQVEDIHRHPATIRESAKGKNRILKIPFKTKKGRDTFLYGFRNAVKNISTIPQKITVRRDMTKAELAILYSLRREAYEKNKLENLFKYIVVDLSFVTLKSPRPLGGQ